MTAVFQKMFYGQSAPAGSMIFYLASFLISFSVVFFITPLLCRFSTKFNVFIDQPDDRRIHSRAVPRCGGIGVFLGFNISCYVLLFMMPGFSGLGGSLTVEGWYHYLIGATGLLLLGLYDDAVGVRWWTKLLGQSLVALFMFSVGVSVNSVLNVALGEWLNLIATVVWFLAIINAFNLIDGLDGLASGLAIFGAIGLAALVFYNRSPADAVVLVGFIGACLAFLYYNFYPARIFLGDSGSMFLGFSLAAIGLSTGHKTTVVTALGVPLLAMGVPLFDTVLAIWRRSVRHVLSNTGINEGANGIVGADLEHLHHRLCHAGWTQRKVALVLYFASALLVGVGIISLFFNSYAGGVFFLAFVVGGFVIVRHIAQVELWDSGRLIVQGLRRPPGRALPMIAYPLIDFVSLGLSLATVLLLTGSFSTWPEYKQLLMFAHPLWCASAFFALVIFGAYNRVWSRARVVEYLSLAIALLLSSAFSLSIEIVLLDVGFRGGLVKTLLFFCISTILVVGVRILPRAVYDLMWLRLGQGRGPQGEQERVLIYGAGVGYKQYLESIGASGISQQIVGLIDDERNLRKRYICGYQVLGCGDELVECLSRYQVDRLVLTCAMPQKAVEAVLKHCRESDVDFFIFKAYEQQLYCSLRQQVEIEVLSEAGDSALVDPSVFSQLPGELYRR